MPSLFGRILTLPRSEAPVPVVAPVHLAGPMQSWRGEDDLTAQLDTFGQHQEIFAAVDRSAEVFASKEWTLYRRSRGAPKEDRVEVGDHPALTVFNEPNPHMTGHELRYLFSVYRSLIGESFWLPSLGPGNVPLELWPIMPTRFVAIPDPRNLLRGWTYLGPMGERVDLTVDQVIFARRPNPTNPIRGTSPIRSMLIDLDAARNASMYQAQFFYNSARPGGIIEFPEGITDADWNQFVDRWQASHKGVMNAHRVAVIERGTWKDRSFSMKDLEFTGLRQAGRESILFALGMSKTMLGQTEDVNRATAMAAMAVHADAVTKPALRAMKSLLNTRFLPRFPGAEQLEFDHEPAAEADPELEDKLETGKVERAVNLIGIGFDPEETMERMGLPSITWNGFPDAGSVPRPPPPRPTDGPGDADAVPG